MTEVGTAHAISPDSGTHWTEPGAWPAAPGVHRIPLPLPMDGLRAVNVYAIETDDGLTLIDGGWAIEVSRALLESSLREIGREVRDIDRFLVTHVHRDHYTQAVTVRREVGSHVSLGLGDKATLDLIRRRDRLEDDPHVALLRAVGAPDIARAWADFTRTNTPDLSLWDDPDTWLDGDLELAVGARTIDAVHTPGHTQGHYVFADRPGGLLFAGDHVLPTITPSIGFEPALAELPLGDFMASLTKVRGLPDLTLLPAHGPVAPSSHARVDALLAHHEVRLDLCVAAIGDGSHAAYDVAGSLPWTRHEHRLADLDVFNTALAILETRAHLELLVARGVLVRGETDGVEHYTAA
ncbi:MBL fold metallo-hydrolase [Nocardioides currus]|uniref:MBL fold metallo-hydrolase n=1 Tax=Nocardioides currus TaxID=2133958 RepID=A0A2R7Z2H4_9ACTN|nr:MBL fold metallo-hydrolase [Nocardioides currus]PUA82774.1 MBL fold metallo-hydrolase [Nocardioides currus]